MPLPDPLLGMAARAERPPLDHAGAPAVCSSPARLSGRVAEVTRTQPIKKAPEAGAPVVSTAWVEQRHIRRVARAACSFL